MPVPRRTWSGAPTRALITLAAVLAAAAALAPSAGAATTPYAPQPDRNVEWSVPAAGLSDGAIANIAANDGWEVIPKFAYDFDLQKQFDLTRRLRAAATEQGNHLRVLGYYNSTFWYLANPQKWGSFADGFQAGREDPATHAWVDSWYLLDSAHQRIPYSGLKRAGRTAPIGYVVDVTNPAYRRWAALTVRDMVTAGDWDGIALDAAVQLTTGTKRLSYDLTNSQLLCGDRGAPDAPCRRVGEFNAGLEALVAGVRRQLHPLGKQVLYNGVAPGELHGPRRNIGLLDDADATSNESFCMNGGVKGIHRFQDALDDIQMMRSIGDRHKQIVEITNYGAASFHLREQYGTYCTAVFLLGWQPGSSYQVQHIGYVDPLVDATTGQPATGPAVADANLDVGLPTAQMTRSGDLLVRRFEHGTVVVNATSARSNYRLRDAAERFAAGKDLGPLPAGRAVRVPPHSALLLLDPMFAGRSAAKLASELPVGGRLLAGDRLETGGFALTMRRTGALVETDATGQAVWTTGTAGAGMSVTLRADGRLVVGGSGGTPWSSGAAVAEGTPVKLVLHADGSLTIDDAGTTVWRASTRLASTLAAPTTLHLGQSLRLGAQSLVVTATGDVQLLQGVAVRWHAGTVSTAADTRLTVSADGDAQLLAGTGTVLWSTGLAAPVAGSALTLDRDAGLRLVAPDGSVAWTAPLG